MLDCSVSSRSVSGLGWIARSSRLPAAIGCVSERGQAAGITSCFYADKLVISYAVGGAPPCGPHPRSGSRTLSHRPWERPFQEQGPWRGGTAVVSTMRDRPAGNGSNGDSSSPAAGLPWRAVDAPTRCRRRGAGAGEGAADVHQDVAPILQQKCQNCHRRNHVGPFSLETYEQARKRATDIAVVAGDRMMPPGSPCRGMAQSSSTTSR